MFNRKAKPVANRSISLPRGYVVTSATGTTQPLSYVEAMRTQTHLARHGQASTVKAV